MVGRGGVEDDDVVEVCGDAFQAFDDLVDDLDEPAGGGAATLPCGIASHSKSRLGVQNAVSGMVSLSMVIRWKEETRSKRKK